MKNGVIWKDIDGNDIQAHGGCIIEHSGVFYWYGEHKGADNCPDTRRVDAIGVSCYSSKDLVNWKYEGLVLESDKDNPQSPIHTSKVMERPKVIYNEKNNNFVLWIHLDTCDYTFAGIGVAVSEAPTGPFTLINVKQPNRQDSRDMTVFRDNDKTAYLVHSKDWNATINISRLNEDYTDVDGFYTSVMIDQYREAPAVFYHNNIYYMITSGCTGWNPNPALFSRSEFIMGKWLLIDNPCRGERMSVTFDGQSTYIFEVNGKFYIMLDHWIPTNLKKSGYSILPIEITADNNLLIPWQDEWNGLTKD